MTPRDLIVVAMVTPLILCSCNKDEQYGSLAVALEEGYVAEVVTKGNVSDYASLPDNGAFSLTITGGKKAGWSGPLSDWDSGTKLKAGTYKAVVNCGDPEQEGPERPYFTGEKEFNITGGEVSEVGIPVSLGNCVVKISCTDAFNSYFKTSSFTITTGAGNVFSYTGSGIFIDAYKFTVSGSVTAQNGASYNLADKTWTVKGATCYNVKYDVDNVGSVTVTISFDDTVETVTLTEDLNA